MNIAGLARRYFPILIWGAQYSQRTFAADLIDTIILISQSPAHELLAGLPPQVELYTSMDIVLEKESNHG
jgi:SulP family sulfate permease